MANAFTYQVIKDTTEHTVIKLTGKFDGTGQEDNNRRITANTLSGMKLLDQHKIILDAMSESSDFPDRCHPGQRPHAELCVWLEKIIGSYS